MNWLKRVLVWIAGFFKKPETVSVYRLAPPTDSDIKVVEGGAPRIEGLGWPPLPFREQLTKNFHIDEFECHNGTVVPEEFYENVLELAENLQVLRNEVGKPIRVVSGYRTPDYNKKIGGAKKSQHMVAKAADIKIKGIGPKRLSDRVKALIAEDSMKKGGVAVYPTFTHYDVRGTNARWVGTRKKS